MIAPSTNMLAYTARHFNSHLCVTLPVPTKSYQGKTVIVTGANVGMGLEAARHFVRLGAGKVILGVRSPEKGRAAAEDIAASVPDAADSGVVEVWELDLCRYASVQAFAARVDRELESLDVAVLNAGVFQYDFVREEADDANVTVNVVSTLLLAISLLPKLRATAARSHGQVEGVLTFVGSFTHWMTPFSERKAAEEEGGIFGRLADEKKSGKDLGQDRYYVSKLVQLLLVRELAAEMLKRGDTKEGRVVASVVNPGFVQTQIMRYASPAFKVFLTGLRKVFARTAEEGARTLLHAAAGGEETHGAYLDDCRVSSPSAWVLSEEGNKVQKQLWRELSAKLEKIQPGIMQNV